MPVPGAGYFFSTAREQHDRPDLCLPFAIPLFLSVPERILEGEFDEVRWLVVALGVAATSKG
jgi:hypothetical protein